MSNSSEETASETTQKIKKAFSPINTNDRLVKQNFLKPDKRLGLQHHGVRRLVLSVGFILLIIVATTFAINFFAGRDSGSTSNQIQSVFSAEELKDYTSPENGFTILMPGIPEIVTSTQKSGDKDIPVTTYERIIENSAKDYTFAVYDFGALPQLDETTALESALNTIMQNTPGSELKSTNANKYNGLNAVEATYSVTDKEKVYEGHLRHVIKGSKMYTMILIGGDQTKFDEYANSLRFN